MRLIASAPGCGWCSQRHVAQGDEHQRRLIAQTGRFSCKLSTGASTDCNHWMLLFVSFV